MDVAKRDRLTAMGVTAVATILMLLLLLLTGLHYDERLSKSENPEWEEEEVFLDPEILLTPEKSVGEPDAVVQDSPAQEIKGEPNRPRPNSHTR